jgi:RNA polymerase sigma-70 factor (ECF subfamily)
MVSGTRPGTRKDERIPVSGPVTLSFQNPSLTIGGELKDVSLSGLCVEHDYALLQLGTVAKIQYANLEKKTRVVWVHGVGDRFQSGLLHQEAYLIARALAGDETAFSELVSPYLPNVRLAILSMLRNAADAEEAMQEALLKVTLHLDQFRSGTDFKPWLYRIATHEALKRLRWNRRHVHNLTQAGEQDGESTQNLIEKIADPNGSPADILERKEFSAAIFSAVESLGEKYRQIFIACDLRQLPVIEAARRIGINIDTANTRLHRARILMRKQLRAYYPKGVRQPWRRNLGQLTTLP